MTFTTRRCLRSRARLAGAVFGLVALAGPARTALAADPPPAAASNDAAVHFSRGVTLYSEGDFSAALVEFKRAYEVAPTWRVLFNIGQAHFELHEYVEAHAALQRFLDEGGAQVKPKQRELAQSELAALAERIGRVKVESNVEGATISVDDQAVGVAPLANPVLMSAGVRRLTATADGRPPVEMRVPVAGGDNLSVHLDFAPEVPAASASAADATRTPQDSPLHLASTPPDDRPRPPNRTAAYVTFGVGAAGLVVGSTFGVLALHDRSQLDQVCINRACPPSQNSAIQSLSRDALVSDIGFGVALAGAIAGVVLWIAAPSGTPASSIDGRAPAQAHDTGWRVGPGGLAATF
jgi:hypothetical protein